MLKILLYSSTAVTFGNIAMHRIRRANGLRRHFLKLKSPILHHPSCHSIQLHRVLPDEQLLISTVLISVFLIHSNSPFLHHPTLFLLNHSSEKKRFFLGGFLLFFYNYLLFLFGISRLFGRACGDNFGIFFRNSRWNGHAVFTA